MAARARSFRRRRRQRTIWTEIRKPAASLPSILLDETTPIDGAFSGLDRYSGTDFTVKRTIVDFSCTIDRLANAANAQTMLELCVGLSWFDSQADVDGQATNQAMLGGTGPLDDINNSRWFVRCCVLIPMGFLQLRVPSATNDTGMSWTVPGGSVKVLGNTAAGQQVVWDCHIDTKAQRAQHGQESEWLNVALQGRIVQGDLAAGQDIACFMDAFMGRQVLAIKS